MLSSKNIKHLLQQDRSQKFVTIQTCSLMQPFCSSCLTQAALFHATGVLAASSWHVVLTASDANGLDAQMFLAFAGAKKLAKLGWSVTWA